MSSDDNGTSSTRRRGDRSENNVLVDLTGVDPGEVMSRRSTRDSDSSERLSLISSGQSGVSSTTAARRVTAAEKLNKDLLFGETTLPEDLDEEWSFISSKNAQKRVSHATSTIDTLIHVIKGNVGPGLLSLAFAVSNAGYVVGPLGILFIGIIAVHNMGLLLDSARTLCEWNGIQALDYAETMLFAVKERGGSKRLSKAAKVAVNIFLIITQFGFCSVYFVFIGQTLQQVMSVAFNIDLHYKAWSAMMILPIVIFSWIRNLDNLAPLAFIANIGMFFGLFVIIADEIIQLSSGKAAIMQDEGSLNSQGSFIHTCIFFGNAIYAFEGIGVVLPLENKMKEPKNAKHVIYGGMSSIVFLYVSFSLLGYLVYGGKIQASIPLNLCGTNAATTTIYMLAKLGIAVAVFITYMVMFYVPMDFLEPFVYKKIKLDMLAYKYPKYHGLIHNSVQILFRTSMVLVTAILALAIPDLDDLITLVGAVASSALALIFPPLIEMLTFWNDPERKWFGVLPKPFWVSKNIIVMILGLLGFALGTFAALYNIVMNLEGKNHISPPCPDSDCSFCV